MKSEYAEDLGIKTGTTSRNDLISSDAVLGEEAVIEEAVIEESLFFKDCGNDRCVYNVKGNCRCRNIGSECQSYIK